MTNPWLKKLSKETGKSELELEKYWKKAKATIAEAKGVSQEDFTSAHYSLVAGIVKRDAGLKEHVPNFMKSKMSAREFIETVVSGQFNSINKDGLVVSSDAHKKKATQLTPALSNMEHSDEKDPEEGKELDFGDMGGTAGSSQAGDGGGIGESVEDSTNSVLEEDSEDDTNYNFDFLNEVEERE